VRGYTSRTRRMYEVRQRSRPGGALWRPCGQKIVRSLLICCCRSDRRGERCDPSPSRLEAHRGPAKFRRSSRGFHQRGGRGTAGQQRPGCEKSQAWAAARHSATQVIKRAAAICAERSRPHRSRRSPFLGEGGWGDRGGLGARQRVGRAQSADALAHAQTGQSRGPATAPRSRFDEHLITTARHRRSRPNCSMGS
jgi:hypothetical protein